MERKDEGCHEKSKLTVVITAAAGLFYRYLIECKLLYHVITQIRNYIIT